MKFVKKSTLLMMAIGLVLYACSPDNIAPTENSNNPRLAGSVGDPHPSLDTVCGTSDTIFLLGPNGSRTVNRCFGPYGEITCPTGQMNWGFVLMNEGYYNDSSYIDYEWCLAPGWFVDSCSWLVGSPNDFVAGPNGEPIINNGWRQAQVNPVQNKWQLRVATNSMPAGKVAFSGKLRVVRISLMTGLPRPGSETYLRAQNRNWNKQGHPAQSNNQYLAVYQPVKCLDVAPPDTAYLCKAVYKGLTATGNVQNCANLTPRSDERGAITYAWSTGATTQNLQVCPTENTTYSVTISSDGVAKHVIVYGVKAIDLTCNLFTDDNGAAKGSGNHGCKHGKSGSGGGHNHDGAGGSGSGHRPGCNHNHGNKTICNSTHEYGCDANHTSGACNHRGHGYHCDMMHSANQSCDGGHTRGCTGQHSSTQLCTVTGGHKYRCNGQHTGGTCNTLTGHTDHCIGGTHGSGKGCNDGHAHKVGRHGNGSGNGSGANGGHGSAVPQKKGVQICHIPPGHPEQAISMCVDYNRLDDHVQNVLSSNPSGKAGSGHGHHGSGHHGHHGSHGSGHHKQHGVTGSQTVPQAHNSTNGHRGSYSWGGNGSGKTGSGHNGSHLNGSGQSGSHHPSGNGSGNHGQAVHPGDIIGACESNPCL